MGKPEKATGAFRAASVAAEKTRNRTLETRVLLAVAGFDQDHDRYDAALPLYLTALRGSLRADDHRRAAQALIGLGEVHQLIGDLDDAERWFNDALEQGCAAHDLNLQFRVQVMLASVAADRENAKQMGDRTQAALGTLRTLLQEWFASRAATGFPLTPDGAVALQMLGEVEAWRGNVASAIIDAKLALALHRVASRTSPSALSDISLDLSHLALAYTQAERLDEAWRILEEARGVDSRIHDRNDYLLLNQMGSVRAREGRLDEALALHAQAIDVLERIGRQQRAGGVHLSLREQTVSFYLDAVSVLLKDQAKHPAQSNATQAWQYLERGHAQTLLELLTEAHDPGAGRLRGIARALAEQTPRRSQTDRTLDDAIAREQAALSASSSLAVTTTGRPVESPHIASIADVQGILDDHTIVLEYAFGETVGGEDVAALWLITRHGVRLTALPRANRIADLVTRYRETLKSPLFGADDIKNHVRLGQRLHQLLLLPAAEDIKHGEHIIVIPAGALHSLPFETLIGLRRGGPGSRSPTLQSVRYVGKQHAVSYAPSASILVFLAKRRSAPKPEGRRTQVPLLAFGDPLHTSSPEPGPVGSDARSHHESMSQDFPRLPYSADEVERIASLYDLQADADAINLRERATKRRLEAMDLTRYRILHFATHAVAGDGVQWVKTNQPTLVLSSPAAEDDPLLTMSDIFDLHLDADLVVLSACNTAQGKLYRGEGLVGLASAFLYAGSQSVVASLWPVNDQSTSLFMEAFYRRLRGGTPKAEALRLARNETMERTVQSAAVGGDQSLAAPYFWAPFVLIGQGD